MRYFADIDAPFYIMLDKKVTWHWINIEEPAICSLCTALCSHPVLALLDFTKPFCIDSYALDTAAGNVLTQEHTSIHKPIALLSKILTSSEQNYNVHNYELLAIITCCKS